MTARANSFISYARPVSRPAGHLDWTLSFYYCQHRVDRNALLFTSTMTFSFSLFLEFFNFQRKSVTSIQRIETENSMDTFTFFFLFSHSFPFRSCHAYSAENPKIPFWLGPFSSFHKSSANSRNCAAQHSPTPNSQLLCVGVNNHTPQLAFGSLSFSRNDVNNPAKVKPSTASSRAFRKRKKHRHLLYRWRVFVAKNRSTCGLVWCW